MPRPRPPPQSHTKTHMAGTYPRAHTHPHKRTARPRLTTMPPVAPHHCHTRRRRAIAPPTASPPYPRSIVASRGPLEAATHLNAGYMCRCDGESTERYVGRGIPKCLYLCRMDGFMICNGLCASTEQKLMIHQH